MKKKQTLLTIALGMAAIGIYRAVKGKGTFNKIRFADQHEAVSRYVESHHPGAVYSAIDQVGDGWSCVITENGERYLLYMTCSVEGIYIFDESKL